MGYLIPILLAVAYGFVMMRFSAWSTKRQLTEKSRPLKDEALDPLIGRMADALDLPNIKVNLYDVEMINGLAAPDGRIFITRGFYNEYRDGSISGEEMASVVAHELGHVALGHTKRRMVDFSAQNAARAALTMIIGRFIPFVGPMIANAVISLFAAGLSRADEYEADAYASALLLKSGIGLDGQKSLFRKLDALTKSRAGAAPAWLLSHPKSRERIAAIEANAKKWGVD
ncbi:MAG: M48 family metallopeptidase [Rhodobacteraceae bacterium]|nr:M48 family metallopeptidase [Paracoccaceae bacterium]